jgi:PleD family two-component response regulator
MTQINPSDSHEPDSGTNNTGQVVSDGKIKSLSSSNTPVHKRILVVDDNSDIAFTLKIGLEDSDQNMQVHSFDNPITALLEFKPDFYDLLLIDVNMPLMDGFQLTHKLLPFHSEGILINSDRSFSVKWIFCPFLHTPLLLRLWHPF